MLTVCLYRQDINVSCFDLSVDISVLTETRLSSGGSLSFEKRSL